MTRKYLINIKTTDVRRDVHHLSKMAPKYGDHQSLNHLFKVILPPRSQKLCSKVSKIYLYAFFSCCESPLSKYKCKFNCFLVAVGPF